MRTPTEDRTATERLKTRSLACIHGAVRGGYGSHHDIDWRPRGGEDGGLELAVMSDSLMARTGTDRVNGVSGNLADAEPEHRFGIRMTVHW